MRIPDQPLLRDGATYDVIVVGGRAAGAATAMLLARSGLDILLLEQGSFGSDTLSTHALMRGGVMQLSRWGLLDQIIAAGTPAVHATTFRYGTEVLEIKVKPKYGVDALYAPRRTLLDPTLVLAAIDAGVEAHDRTMVIDLVRRNGRVAGVIASTAEGFVELHAPLVIGADGIRSTIARHVGAAYTHRAEHTGAVTYGYWENLETNGYEFAFKVNACSGIIPTNDGRACVFAGGRPERIGRGGVALIEEIVAEGAPDIVDRLRDATPPAGTRSWQGLPGYMRQASGPGWALVGDAGYFKDPISAHGLTDALRDAELLALAVVDGAASQAAMDAALADFGALRDRLSLRLFGVTAEIAAQQWDDRRIAELLYELSQATNDEVERLAALDPVATAVAS